MREGTTSSGSQNQAGFLASSDNLKQQIGTLLLAIHEQVEADEAREQLTLAEWYQWLSDEGYPVDEALEKLRAQVSPGFHDEVNALTAQIAEHLGEPEGLAALSNIIDSQQSLITDQLHQLMEQGIAMAQASYGIAGGTNKKAIYWSAGATAALVGGIVWYRRRKRNAEEGAALENQAREAFHKSMKEIAELKREMEEGVLTKADNAEKRLIISPTQDEAIVMSKQDELRLIKAGRVSFSLKKELKDFSRREVEFHAQKLSSSLAKEFVGHMEKREGERLMQVTIGDLKSAFKARSIAQETERLIEKEGKAEAIEITYPMLYKSTQKVSQLDEDLDHDIMAEVDATQFFEESYAKAAKEAIQKSFKIARDSKNAEVKRLDINLTNVFTEAKKRVDKKVRELKRDIKTDTSQDIARMKEDEKLYARKVEVNTKRQAKEAVVSADETIIAIE
jgi:hypothetical protein